MHALADGETLDIFHNDFDLSLSLKLPIPDQDDQPKRSDRQRSSIDNCEPGILERRAPWRAPGCVLWILPTTTARGLPQIPGKIRGPVFSPRPRLVAKLDSSRLFMCLFHSLQGQYMQQTRNLLPCNFPSRKARALGIGGLDTGHLNRISCPPACNASVSEHAREEDSAGANR